MQLKEIYPQIFLLTFSKLYDLAMHFLRYQEYFESPAFKGKLFSIIDFMEWYSEKHGEGSFTYPVDWAGYNIPGKIIKEVMDKGIPDFNKYDATMQKIYSHCNKSYPDFYLIGTLENPKTTTFEHELAHALYYLNPEYKNDMDSIIEKMDKKEKKLLIKRFKEMGYHKSVFIDEIQAYSVSNRKKKFVEVLKKYAL